jgi:hypothetical protein
MGRTLIAKVLQEFHFDGLYWDGHYHFLSKQARIDSFLQV